MTLIEILSSKNLLFPKFLQSVRLLERRHGIMYVAHYSYRTSE